MNTMLIAVGGFIVLLAILIVARSRTKFEIKNSDIVLALIPIVLWLLLTGKIQEVTIGDLKIVTAIKAASNTPVESQVTALPVETISSDSKEGVDKIPSMIRRQVQALSFRLGYRGYWGPAIEEYLRRLTEHPYLKYVVIEKDDGSLFGLVDAGQLSELMTGANSWLSPRDFERWLVEADTAKIKSLPQFIPYYECVWQTSDKRRALEIMNERDVQFWPVRDKEGMFVGVVDRSKLTASMLIDIADRLETKP